MRAWLIAPIVLAACGGGMASPDAADRPDATTAAPDAPGIPDATVPLDAAAVPLPGFGDLSGMCGVLGEPELTGTTPSIFQGALDFGTDRYDDPADRDQLTAGGQIIVALPNAGGSSVFSEVFAFEELARCELATLLKTETQIEYTDPNSKKADLLVEIDGHPIGVSVTRAVTFPFGDPYTPDAATTLITRKLDDIAVAQANAVTADHWDKSMVAALAYDAQHADVLAQAWADLDPAVKRDSVVVIFVTDGDDLFIYTDQ